MVGWAGVCKEPELCSTITAAFQRQQPAHSKLKIYDNHCKDELEHFATKCTKEGCVQSEEFRMSKSISKEY